MVAGALALGLLTACAADPEPVHQKVDVVETPVPEYDASLEPSAAVLPLVPADVTTISVTDFDQLRLVLGFGALDSESPAGERDRFWTQVPRTAALSTGLLRPVDERLRADFGFSSDDVAWEATWPEAEEGSVAWIIAFHDDTSMAAVQRAVRAGVGLLSNAVVDTDRRLVSSAPLPEPADAWGADPALVAMSGRTAVATYLHRGCLEFDDVFGDGMEAQLAAAPAATMRALDELDAFTVAFGAELATVQLGPERGDAFDRARLADVMPETEPEFAQALSKPVADPASGRVGYTIGDAAAAAELATAQTLPFAVCPG
ncbi:hypothetical protein GCM10025786_23950 [Nocardioides caeni]